MDDPALNFGTAAQGRGPHRLLRFVLRPGRLSKWWWFALSGVLTVIDYGAGPYVQFPVTFLVPVFLAAWYSGMAPALVLALLLPLVRATMMMTVFDEPWDASAIVTTAMLRMGVFAFHAVLISRLSDHEREITREIELLEHLLPICMHCKSIRSDDGSWENLEHYVSSRSPTRFSHGLCAACAEKHYPDVWKPKAEKAGRSGG